MSRPAGGPTGFEAARERVRSAAERAGRDPASVTLIVVTKTVNAERVRAVVAAGALDLGENRVQEALGKQRQLGDASVRWHLLGHLQTNKAVRAASAFSSIHSIDSERIARALGERRAAGMPPLPIFIEVDLTGLDARTGVAPASLDAVFDAVREQPALHTSGLMTVAPQASGPERRAAFARLRSLRDDLEQRSGDPLPGLSMGMSDDFEIAIEEGATVVRLGRAIFGGRPGTSPQR